MANKSRSPAVMPSYAAIPTMANGEDHDGEEFDDMDYLMDQQEYDGLKISMNCQPQTIARYGKYSLFIVLIAFMSIALVMNVDQFKLSSYATFSNMFGLSLDETSENSFVLSSPSFLANGDLPPTSTCKFGTETGVSPPLAWKGAPEGTVDYLITMKKESGYSWSVYDISSDVDHLDEAVSNAAASGATVGLIAGTEAWDIDVPPYISTANYVSMYKYEEPCSKGPGEKWYLFTIYAFSRRAADVMAENNFAKENTKPTQILEIMDSYILGKAEITAYFNLYDDDASAAVAKEETKVAEASGVVVTGGVELSDEGKAKNGGSDPKHSSTETTTALAVTPPTTTSTTTTSTSNSNNVMVQLAAAHGESFVLGYSSVLTILNLFHHPTTYGINNSKKL